MKRQIIALVAGAALITAPLMTHIATADMAGVGHGSGRKIEKMAATLKFTPEQKAKLQAIRQETQTKIKAVLTPDQQAKLEAARAERQQQWEAAKANGGTPSGAGQRMGRGGMMKDIGLTSEQKAQIKAIRQAAKAEMKAVLTPDQQTQLEQMQQQRKQAGQQRRNSQ
jgi:Spy/CpxP family protein refolding chaperone